VNPKTGLQAHAVVQLRTENAHRSCYNLVGFQTKLTYGDQKRVFRMIPGLEQAEFLRYGSLHRNTFINSPQLLRDTLQFKARGTLFFAGQLVGVEGYAAAHHGAWLSTGLHHDHGPSSFSADEYEFRALSSPCHTDERQGTQTTAHGTTGA